MHAAAAAAMRSATAAGTAAAVHAAAAVAVPSLPLLLPLRTLRPLPPCVMLLFQTAALAANHFNEIWSCLCVPKSPLRLPPHILRLWFLCHSHNCGNWGSFLAVICWEFAAAEVVIRGYM